MSQKIDLDKLKTLSIKTIDEAVEILEGADFMLERINSRPGKDPVTATELAAALTANIVIDCVTSQLESLRDPENYWEEEYHGQ